MDDERIRFLYGDDLIDELDGWDLTDEGSRLALLEESVVGLPPMARTLRAIVADHILDDDPPEVWATAQRLLAEGLDPESITEQLALALEPTIFAAVRADLDPSRSPGELDDAIARVQPGSMARYLEALANLPLPSPATVEDAIVAIVHERPGIGADDLVGAACERIGRVADDAVTSMVEHLVDDVIRDGAIDMVAGDRLVAPDGLTARAVLTRRLNESEVGAGIINASFDLSPFGRPEHLHLGDDVVEVASVERGQLAWIGPKGWLSAYEPGTVVAVRLGDGASVAIEALDDSPPLDPDLVARLRAAYDHAVAEPGLPVSSTELVLALLLDDPDAFAAPRPPLSELAEAAGLEVRRDEVADDESIWFTARATGHRFRISDLLRDHPERVGLAARRVLDAVELAGGADPSWIADGRPLDDDRLLEALTDLRDEDVLLAVLDTLTADRDDESIRITLAFADALLAVEGRTRDRATAHLFAALVAERRGLPVDAEEHFHRSQRLDGSSAFVADRLAWYASDRGDAATADRLWRQLELDDTLRQDLAAIEPFARPRAASLGRNEPCWCGSGRKFKQCHLGQSERAPLPDRVDWLLRKAAGFLERRGPSARMEAIGVAAMVATDPFDTESLMEAFDHPIVLDLALTELGWFERFLEERGELLPDDERLLASSWRFVERTVHEVVAVRPGEGVDLRDVRTGDIVEVRERTLSRDARPGELICARAVPDGETHQLVGAVLRVDPGRERGLLAILDEGDPYAIARWVRAGELPPMLTNREGEPFRECEITFRVPDEDDARAFLDATYVAGPREGSWEEVFEIDAAEQVQRATLHLDRTLISVATNSDARADRIVAAVLGALPGSEVRRDERTDLDARLAALMAKATADGFDVAPGDWDDDDATVGWDDEWDDDDSFDPPSLDLDDPEVRAAVEEIRDGFEERWCDEPVPALGGRTPRECAEDPTRREEVIRLIASFDDVEAGGDLGPAITMRPARLRELLGL